LVERPGPSGFYDFQFFANHACDPSGYGEGESLLGTVTATPNSSGQAQIDFTPASLVPLSQFITALATDSSMNTSTFSNCARVITLSQVFLPLIHGSSAAQNH
jgi:hypothetical protein